MRRAIASALSVGFKAWWRNGLLIAPRFDDAAKARVQARAFFHRLLRWRHHPRTLLLHPVDQHRDRGRREDEAERDGSGRPEHQVEAATSVEERNRRDRRARGEEGEEIAHRVDAAAPGV